MFVFHPFQAGESNIVIQCQLLLPTTGRKLQCGAYPIIFSHNRICFTIMRYSGYLQGSMKKSPRRGRGGGALVVHEASCQGVMVPVSGYDRLTQCYPDRDKREGGWDRGRGVSGLAIRKPLRRPTLSTHARTTTHNSTRPVVDLASPAGACGAHS